MNILGGTTAWEEAGLSLEEGWSAFADQPVSAVGDTVTLEATPSLTQEAGSEDAELDSFLATLAVDGEKPQAKAQCSPGTCSFNFDCRVVCPYFGQCHDADPNIPCSGWCECIS